MADFDPHDPHNLAQDWTTCNSVVGSYSTYSSPSSCQNASGGSYTMSCTFCIVLLTLEANNPFSIHRHLSGTSDGTAVVVTSYEQPSCLGSVSASTYKNYNCLGIFSSYSYLCGPPPVVRTVSVQQFAGTTCAGSPVLTSSVPAGGPNSCVPVVSGLKVYSYTVNCDQTGGNTLFSYFNGTSW